jgi:cytochrome c
VPEVGQGSADVLQEVGQGFSPASHVWRKTRRWLGPATHLFACVLLACLAAACENRVKRTAMQITGGDPERAASAIRRYGCGSCHTIPGIDGAHAVVGPPLTSLAKRAYIAGHLSNNPDMLIRWIRHPHSFKQQTAMPEMGVGEQDARDIAAYLYTLQ